MLITLTGDSIPMRRLAHLENANLKGVIQFLSESDATFTNAEFTIPGRHMMPSATFGGHHVAAPSFALSELGDLGFNVLSIANNHSLDYSVQGLIHLLDRLEDTDWVYAGAGKSLDAASQPAYLDSPRGRIALIALTSSNARLTTAADPKGKDSGRPGVHPLRYSTKYAVKPEDFAAIDRIAKSMRFGGIVDERAANEIYFTYPDRGLYGARRTVGSLWLGPMEFIESDTPQVVTAPLEVDLRRINRQIEAATLQARTVLVSMHCHEGLDGGWNTGVPAQFVESAARSFVDAGAHAVSGTGPHQLRGIEIYRGRPIFYSLGNFIFMIDSQTQIPGEDYENVELPSDAIDFYDFRKGSDPGYPRGMRRSVPQFWQSVIVRCDVADREVRRVELHPISLGRMRERWESGFPTFAEDDEAEEILEHLRELSAVYQTKIDLSRSSDNRLIGTIDCSS